jgi:hypothetical protein
MGWWPSACNNREDKVLPFLPMRYVHLFLGAAQSLGLDHKAYNNFCDPNQEWVKRACSKFVF